MDETQKSLVALQHDFEELAHEVKHRLKSIWNEIDNLKYELGLVSMTPENRSKARSEHFNSLMKKWNSDNRKQVEDRFDRLIQNSRRSIEKIT